MKLLLILALAAACAHVPAKLSPEEKRARSLCGDAHLVFIDGRAHCILKLRGPSVHPLSARRPSQ